MVPHLTEKQRHTLLTALSLTAQTRATLFESYHLLDALIDLEDYSFIEYDEWLFNLAENKLANLSDSEVLNLILELTQSLKQEAIAA